MVNISENIINKIISGYGAFFGKLGKISADKCAHDVVDEEKVHDQIRVLCDTTGMSIDSLRNKKILEVGSGFGLFVFVSRRDYGCDTVGIEPAEPGFDSSFTVSREIAKEYGISEDVIINAKGENIPFPDCTFDIIFSSTVLEHTEDPEAVIRESIRVLKPGGYMQFVFPNYASFFEGHYAVPWIPYMNNKLGEIWVSLFGRDPAFMRSLKLLTFKKTKKIVRKNKNVKVISYGQETFKKRMSNFEIREWAGLVRLKRWVNYIRKIRMIPLATWLLVTIGSFEPIILTLKKNKTDT